MEHVNPRPTTYVELHGEGLDRVAYLVTRGGDQSTLPSAPTHSGVPPSPRR
jgi:hypothetical protein